MYNETKGGMQELAPDELLKLSKIAHIEKHKDKVNLNNLAHLIIDELKAN